MTALQENMGPYVDDVWDELNEDDLDADAEGEIRDAEEGCLRPVFLSHTLNPQNHSALEVRDVQLAARRS